MFWRAGEREQRTHLSLLKADFQGKRFPPTPAEVSPSASPRPRPTSANQPLSPRAPRAPPPPRKQASQPKRAHPSRFFPLFPSPALPYRARRSSRALLVVAATGGANKSGGDRWRVRAIKGSSKRQRRGRMRRQQKEGNRGNIEGAMGPRSPWLRRQRKGKRRPGQGAGARDVQSRQEQGTGEAAPGVSSCRRLLLLLLPLALRPPPKGEAGRGTAAV